MYNLDNLIYHNQIYVFYISELAASKVDSLLANLEKELICKLNLFFSSCNIWSFYSFSDLSGS